MQCHVSNLKTFCIVATTLLPVRLALKLKLETVHATIVVLTGCCKHATTRSPIKSDRAIGSFPCCSPPPTLTLPLRGNIFAVAAADGAGDDDTVLVGRLVTAALAMNGATAPST
eukprot:365328-Chlamydomonas_euryale.AAC.6